MLDHIVRDSMSWRPFLPPDFLAISKLAVSNKDFAGWAATAFACLAAIATWRLTASLFHLIYI